MNKMPKPYSIDLREKALALIDKGIKIEQVAALLSVARSTIGNWLRLRRRKGNLAPVQGYRKGHSHKIKDLAAFKQFVDEHNGYTLEMMAQAWGNISDTTIGRMMRKIGYTRKKRHSGTKSAVKKSVMPFYQ